jgi:hypothetical protein
MEAVSEFSRKDFKSDVKADIGSGRLDIDQIGDAPRETNDG